MLGRHLRHRGVLAALVAAIVFSGALTAALSSPAAAAAGSGTDSSPGLHLDPGSPAGKEYALPIAIGRGGGGGRPALFGRGISRNHAAIGRPPPLTSLLHHGSGLGWLWMLAAATLVLVAGAITVLVLRRDRLTRHCWPPESELR